jgi:murein DD-endopeptidase MepM/ murein hydrolase activator NlpD
MLKTLSVALALVLTGCASSGPQFSNIHGPHQTIPGRFQHDGIDILANLGTPVQAARAGRVTWVEHDFDGRLLHPKLIIRHTDSIDIFYYHIDRIQVKVGDTVEQGQIVAYTARTGWRLYMEPGVYPGRPHLHMETRHINGAPFDPMTLPFTCPSQGGEWWWPVGCR